jgi:hypothetical protein
MGPSFRARKHPVSDFLAPVVSENFRYWPFAVVEIRLSIRPLREVKRTCSELRRTSAFDANWTFG